MFNFGKKKQEEKEAKELIRSIEDQMKEALAEGDNEKYWELQKKLEKAVEVYNALYGAPPVQSEKVDGEYTKRRFLDLVTDPKMWGAVGSTLLSIGFGIGYSKWVNKKEEDGELVDSRPVDKATKAPRFKP